MTDTQKVTKRQERVRARLTRRAVEIGKMKLLELNTALADVAETDTFVNLWTTNVLETISEFLEWLANKGRSYKQ